MHTGQNFDQRGFSGTIVTHEGDDLSGVDVEVNIIQGGNGAELFSDTSQLQDNFALRRKLIVL
jgi:hypothetical protein